MSNPPRRSCKDRLRTGASPDVVVGACPHQDSNLDWTRSERVASAVGLRGRADPGSRTPTVMALNHVPLPVGLDPRCSERPEGIEPSASVWKTDVSAEFTTTACDIQLGSTDGRSRTLGKRVWNPFRFRSSSAFPGRAKTVSKKNGRRGLSLAAPRSRPATRSRPGAPRQHQKATGDEGENSPSRELGLGEHVFLRLISVRLAGIKLCDGRTAVQRIY